MYLAQGNGLVMSPNFMNHTKRKRSRLLKIAAMYIFTSPIQYQACLGYGLSLR
jgi:hypothetical protein